MHVYIIYCMRCKIYKNCVAIDCSFFKNFFFRFQNMKTITIWLFSLKINIHLLYSKCLFLCTVAHATGEQIGGCSLFRGVRARICRSYELKKCSINRSVCYSKMSIVEISLYINFQPENYLGYYFEKLSQYKLTFYKQHPTRTLKNENQYDPNVSRSKKCLSQSDPNPNPNPNEKIQVRAWLKTDNPTRCRTRVCLEFQTFRSLSLAMV